MHKPKICLKYNSHTVTLFCGSCLALVLVLVIIEMCSFESPLLVSFLIVCEQLPEMFSMFLTRHDGALQYN